MEKMKKTREKENRACVYDNCYMTIVISHFLKSINVAFYNQKVEKNLVIDVNRVHSKTT